MTLPGGRVAKRALVEGLGWLLVFAGVAGLVLPGPGLLVLFAGLALLSQQYSWAERRVEPVKRRALKGAAEGVETWPRICVSTLGVLVLGGAGALWIWSPEVPAWWPFAAWLWLFGGFWTGVTLVFSAVAAAALVGYSYRRFHGKPEAVAALEPSGAGGER